MTAKNKISLPEFPKKIGTNFFRPFFLKENRYDVILQSTYT